MDKAHSAYQIVARPHISEKSVTQNSKGKYVFEVYPGVNKNQIAKAIEKLYDVKVEKVNTVRMPAKEKRYRRLTGYGSRYDKAIVTLQKGQEIEVLPQ